MMKSRGMAPEHAAAVKPSDVVPDRVSCRGSGPDQRGLPAPHYHRPGRSLAIDMLRGIAILMVLGRHYVVSPDNSGVLRPLANAWTTIGWAGVDLFFVLSGFLVSGLIFAEYRNQGKVDLRRFVIRRGFKIWPPYLMYIAAVAAWLAWQSYPQLASVWSELWPNVFHVQNYFHTPRLHTWSLAVEEHFYLAVALVFYWLLRPAASDPGKHNLPTGVVALPAVLRRLPVFIVSCVAGLAALRHAGYVQEGPAELNLYATHLRFDGLLIGTLLAYWTHFKPARLLPVQRHPLAAMCGGIILAAPALIFSPEANAWTAGIGLAGMYVGFSLFMIGWLHVGLVHSGWRRLFASRPAAILGLVGFYSYSIYLWHVDLAQTPIKKLLNAAEFTEASPTVVWPIATILYVVAACVIGALLARCLEMPSLALRDRLFPSTVKPVTTPAAPSAPGGCETTNQCSGEQNSKPCHGYSLSSLRPNA
jgi:peptidoglycan/LPS O-acetylase OafA/YrhL